MTRRERLLSLILKGEGATYSEVLGVLKEMTARELMESLKPVELDELQYVFMLAKGRQNGAPLGI